MDPHVRHLPRRPIPARLLRPARAHVRLQYDLGLHDQGSVHHDLLRGSAADPEAVQIQHGVCACVDRDDGGVGDGAGGGRALRLDDYGFRGHFADGDGGGEPFAAADCAESWVDEVFVLMAGDTLGRVGGKGGEVYSFLILAFIKV